MILAGLLYATFGASFVVGCYAEAATRSAHLCIGWLELTLGFFFWPAFLAAYVIERLRR